MAARQFGSFGARSVCFGQQRSLKLTGCAALFTCHWLVIHAVTGLPAFVSAHLIQQASHYCCQLVRKKWRNGVADLGVLLRPVACKEVVVRKRLKACGFPDGQASALLRIVVNIVVAVLGNMRDYRGGRVVFALYAEAILEGYGSCPVVGLYVVMGWQQLGGKTSSRGEYFRHSAKVAAKKYRARSDAM